MSDTLRALVVGVDWDEINTLHHISRRIVGPDAEMFALEADPTSNDSQLAWGWKRVEVHQLPSDPGGDTTAPIEDVRTLDGDVWRAITDAAHRHEASVVVIASHRQRWLKRVLAGAAAHDLIEHADLPILAVPQAVLEQHRQPADR